MYPEFIPIYIGLVIIIGLAIAILILLICLLKDKGDKTVTPTSYFDKNGNSPIKANQTSGNMAFCKKCAIQFDASERFCPNCGTPR